MCNGVDESLSQGSDWILIQGDVVNTNDACRMERMLVHESENLLNCIKNRGVDICLSAGLSTNLRSCVRIHKNFGLRKIIRRVGAKSQHASGRCKVFSLGRVVPQQ